MPAPDHYYVKPIRCAYRTGAGGVVARVEDGRVKVALIRARRDQEYVLPKGGVEKGETLEQAAKREIEEEAGFSKLTVLGELGKAERLAGKRYVWQTTHYFLFLTQETDPRPTEHVTWEVSWFELDQLPPLYWREQGAVLADNLERIRELALAAQDRQP